MNQKKIGALLSYANIFVYILSAIFYTPILLKILGQNEYGVYSFSNSIVAYLGLINFGFSGAYLKFYSKYKANNEIDNINKLNALYIIVFSCISLLVVIGGLILVFNINAIVGNGFTNEEVNLSAKLLVIMTINMAVTLPFTALCSFVISRERFIFNNFVHLFKNISNPVLCFIILQLGYRSQGICTVLLVVTLCSFFINIIYCNRNLKIHYSFKNIDWSVLKEICSFSVYLFIWSIADIFIWQVGNIVLARTQGSSAVAIYAIVIQFCTLFMMFSTAISSVFTPQIYKVIYENDSPSKLTNIMIKVGRLQFYIILYIWISFFVFGKQFILLWIGDCYITAYYACLLMFTFMIIGLTQNTGIDMLRAANAYKIRSVCHLVFALLNFPISYILSKKMGIYGCAIGTIISIVTSSLLISNLLYYFRLKLSIISFFKEIAKFCPSIAIIFVIGFIFKMYISIDTWTGFIFFSSIFSIIYFVVLYILSANTYERQLVHSFLQKVRNLV